MKQRSTPSAGVAVATRALRHHYSTAKGSITILDGIDMHVAPGEHIAISGASGAGKSTLLALLGGLGRPRSGNVFVGELDVASLDGDELAAYRRKTVGFVFQHFGLLETLSARENIELACVLAGLPSRRRRARAEELLEGVGLAGRANHRPAELSGGERQRVAIARALANRPLMVLADEPTGNLDEESALRVMQLLESLHRQWGYTLIVVTHNHMVAARAARRFALDGGRLLPA